MSDHQKAMEAALKQIDAIKWDAPEEEQPDLGTELVLYLMEKNAALAKALERAIWFIDKAERKSNWSSAPDHEDSVTVELNAILASCDTRRMVETRSKAPLASSAVRSNRPEHGGLDVQ